MIPSGQKSPDTLHLMYHSLEHCLSLPRSSSLGAQHLTLHQAFSGIQFHVTTAILWERLTVPILQMSKLRPRMKKWIAWTHTAEFSSFKRTHVWALSSTQCISGAENNKKEKLAPKPNLTNEHGGHWRNCSSMPLQCFLFFLFPNQTVSPWGQGPWLKLLSYPTVLRTVHRAGAC